MTSEGDRDKSNDRRHQEERAKARGKRMACLFECDSERVAQRYAVDRKPCSCPVCGNPRKYTGKPTRQELKKDDYEVD